MNQRHKEVAVSATPIDPTIRASIAIQAPDLFGHDASAAPSPADMVLALTDKSAPWRMTQKALSLEIGYDNGGLTRIKQGTQNMEDAAAYARLLDIYRKYVQPETADGSDAISADVVEPPIEQGVDAIQPVADTARACSHCGKSFYPPKAAPDAALCSNCYADKKTARKLALDGLSETARGHWPEILASFGIEYSHLTNRHGPCPGCGGTDRFRFDDKDGRGTWVCGGGGTPEAGDGFALLSHVFGWDARTAFLKVAEYFGIEELTNIPPIDPVVLAKRKAEAEAKAKAEADQQHQTAAHAAAIWDAAAPITDDAPNPYLARKGVQPTANLRQIDITAAARIVGYHPTATRDEQRQRLQGVVLVVPLCRDGELTTVELIDHAGNKAALKGSGTKRAAFWLSRAVADTDQTIIIAEGVATALTLAEATGGVVAASGSVGNMKATVSALHIAHSDVKCLIAADLVKQGVTAGKPIDAALKAAQAFRPPLLVLAPEAAEGVTDWNDVHAQFGIDQVIDQVGYQLANALPEAEVIAGTVEPTIEPTNTDVTSKRPKPLVSRPCFMVHDDWTGYGKPGVWWHSTKEKGDVVTEIDQWICTPLYADAVTHGDRDADFGLLLRFKNALGREREWAMPMSMLSGSGEELRSELLNLGVRIDPDAHRLLNRYLMAQYPSRKVIAATCTGWHCDGKAFVLPHTIIGEANVRYQSEQADHDEFCQTGSLAGWQSEIAARCSGNPILILAVAAALAGPLLARVHRQGCGLHFFGDSSIGKSTVLSLGASCWGGAGFIRTWRATGNGLEGTAAMLNDTVLILDEISEADGRELGAIVYAIGNGTGKSRAARTGNARAVKRWRVVLLSSGERTLIATMDESGKRTKAGQEARLLDIPSTRTYGVFDTLHGFADGRTLTDTLKTAATRHHGFAGPAFIQRLIADERDFGALLDQITALPLLHSENGIEGRAANVFALIAMAGELASEWGIVPWAEGEALDAAVTAYRLWRDHRGQGQTETKQILQAITDFIGKHGDARFSSLADSVVVRDRAGWWRTTDDGERVYLFTPAALKEAAAGFDQRRILEALDSSGWIFEHDKDERSKVTKTPSRTLRLYAILPTEVAL